MPSIDTSSTRRSSTSTWPGSSALAVAWAAVPGAAVAWLAVAWLAVAWVAGPAAAAVLSFIGGSLWLGRALGIPAPCAVYRDLNVTECQNQAVRRGVRELQPVQ